MSLHQPLGPKARRAQRHKLFEPVLLDIAGHPLRCHLLDLSATGAQAHCETPPRVGQPCIVQVGDVTLRARTIWLQGKRFGLRFEMAVPEGVMGGLLG